MNQNTPLNCMLVEATRDIGNQALIEAILDKGATRYFVQRDLFTGEYSLSTYGVRLYGLVIWGIYDNC